MVFLYVCKRDWWHPGPIVNIVAHNAHSVAALGHETHLCVGRGPESDTDADLREFYGLPPLPALQVHRLARRRTWGGATSSLPIFLGAWRLARELSRRGPVAVITREAAFLPYLALLCRRPAIRGFYEAHDLYADLSWRPKRPKIADLRQKWLERLALPRLSGLICITSAQRDLYAKIFPRLPVCALPLGVKAQPPQVDDDETRRQRRTAVYVGHLSPKKGFDAMMKSIPGLAAARVRLRLWGGDPPDAERLRAKFAAAGLSDEWIRFTGFQPPQVLHEALAAEASVGLVALRDNFYNRYLTCPAKALDYLAHGLPVVASDLPSTREVLGEAGAALYVAPDDPAGLAEAILRLLNDPAAYARAAAAARVRASEFSWEQRARRLVDFVGGLFPNRAGILPAAGGL